jgi:hypothetical protein
MDVFKAAGATERTVPADWALVHPSGPGPHGHKLATSALHHWIPLGIGHKPVFVPKSLDLGTDRPLFGPHWAVLKTPKIGFPEPKLRAYVIRRGWNCTQEVGGSSPPSSIAVFLRLGGHSAVWDVDHATPFVQQERGEAVAQVIRPRSLNPAAVRAGVSLCRPRARCVPEDLVGEVGRTANRSACRDR